jgi:hypothetical protein
MLDNLEGCVDAGGFGDGWHEDNVQLLAVKNIVNILVSTFGIHGGEAA